MKTVGYIFYGIFILLFIAIAGLFLLSRATLAGGTEVKIVQSGSMEPAIKTGSIVLIKPQEEYAVGDIVTFGEDSAFRIPTTHRIVGVDKSVNGTVFSTKGDANEEADPEGVSEREVIGKVLFSLPYAGYLLDFARRPVGFTLLIGIPALLMIIEGIVSILKEIRVMRRKRTEKEIQFYLKEKIEKSESTQALELQKLHFIISDRTPNSRKSIDGIKLWQKDF